VPDAKYDICPYMVIYVSWEVPEAKYDICPYMVIYVSWEVPEAKYGPVDAYIKSIQYPTGNSATEGLVDDIWMIRQEVYAYVWIYRGGWARGPEPYPYT
jgi:hypothetical protein